MSSKNESNAISIKNNAIYNYIGQGYSIIIGIVISPFYMQYLGAESYGLVGFFVLLQNWLNLLDFGLSTTLGRQVAYERGQINGFVKFNNLLKSYELIFSTLAVIIIIGIYFSSDWLAYRWIKSVVLDKEMIVDCIIIMGIIIALRFFSTIYRSGINGFEDQIWLNKANILINSFKYIGSLIILIFISNDIKYFFEYQLALGVLEVALLGLRFYYNLPSINVAITWFQIDWSVFKGVLPFSVSIAYTSFVLIFLTQFDKLLLTGILSLEEFGYFSLITLISGAIISLGIPVFQAFLPRMTLLVSEGKVEDMIYMYINMTQIITWITFSIVLLVSIFAQEVLYVLTGNNIAYMWGGHILNWYILGCGIYVLGTFQYYLQNAFGNLRLYVIGSTLSLLIQAPLIYLITLKYGAMGAGRLWFIYAIIWFLGWTMVVHRKMLPGFHLNWLVKNVLPILFSTVIFAYFIDEFIKIDINTSRLIVMIKISLIGLCFLTVTSLSVHSIRSKLIKVIKRRNIVQH